MNVNFEKQTVATPAEGVTVDVETTTVPAETLPAEAPAVSVPTRPANHSHAIASSPNSPHAIFDDNAIGFDDIILPRLNIVQKVGDLSNVFPGGHIVLDQSQVIYEYKAAASTGLGKSSTTPLRVVVIGLKRTSFVEKVAGGAMGLVCRTEEEVVAKGGTLDYKEWEDSVRQSKENPALKPLRRFDKMTTALLLVEKPASFQDPHKTVFPYEANGQFYMLAFLTLKSSAYNAGAKAIFTFKKTRLINNPNASHSDFIFKLGSELKKFPGNVFAYVPDIEPAEPVTPEMHALVARIKGTE